MIKRERINKKISLFFYGDNSKRKHLEFAVFQLYLMILISSFVYQDICSWARCQIWDACDDFKNLFIIFVIK
jgi:hypothetical protein